jgi:predicted nucleic acid-binding protein
LNGVLDASAFVRLLLGGVDPDDLHLFDGDFAAPDLFLVETASGLRRGVRIGAVSSARAAALLAHTLELPMELVPSRELVGRAFELREAMTVHDACYVALAEQRECGVLSSDRRLSASPGLTVPVTLV